MPLEFTGDENDMLEVKAFRAMDQNGEQVVVHVTREVLQDYGSGAATDVAGQMFDAGAPQPIKVTTEKMKAHGY